MINLALPKIRHERLLQFLCPILPGAAVVLLHAWFDVRFRRLVLGIDPSPAHLIALTIVAVLLSWVAGHVLLGTLGQLFLVSCQTLMRIYEERQIDTEKNDKGVTATYEWRLLAENYLTRVLGLQGDLFVEQLASGWNTFLQRYLFGERRDPHVSYTVTLQGSIFSASVVAFIYSLLHFPQLGTYGVLLSCSGILGSYVSLCRMYIQDYGYKAADLSLIGRMMQDLKDTPGSRASAERKI